MDYRSTGACVVASVSSVLEFELLGFHSTSTFGLCGGRKSTAKAKDAGRRNDVESLESMADFVVFLAALQESQRFSTCWVGEVWGVGQFDGKIPRLDELVSSVAFLFAT